MTHRSNFVTLLSEQALPGQMGGCHTSVQDLMTGGIPGQMGGHHTSLQGLWQEKLTCSSFRACNVQNFAKHMFRRLDASWRHCSQSQRLYLHMHIWYVRYSQMSHSPGSGSNQGAQAEWNRSTKPSHYTVQISGRNSGCIQGVWESERKKKAEGQLHIQVSLLLQISLSWKTTSDLPTAAKTETHLCWWERRKASNTKRGNK